jgi:hypothetical protein
MPSFGRKGNPQSDSNDLSQLGLRFKTGSSHFVVDLDAVIRQPTLNAAIVLCVQSSGLDRKQIYNALNIDAATWSRIESAQANFPVNKLEQLMDLCGNEAPLMWLINARGYDWESVREKQNALEKKLAQAENEIADLKRLIRLRSKVESEL